MKICQFRTMLRTLLLLFLLITLGCAQQMKTVKPDNAASTAASSEILGITVSDDGSKVEILSDKPIVYTFYTLDSPPRVIVDLANTSPSKLSSPIVVNKGSLKKVDVTKHEFGTGVLTRVDISLTGKVDVSAMLDPQDKRKLAINLPVPAPAPQEQAAKETVSVSAVPPAEVVKEAESKPVAVEKDAVGQETAKNEPVKVEPVKVEPVKVEPVKVEPVKVEPVKVEPVSVAQPVPVTLTSGSKIALKPGDRALTAIKKIGDGIVLEFSAEPDSFKSFKLDAPDRLVIDIPKTKSAVDSKPVDINAYNLGKGRVGVSPERLRLVLDASGGKIPPYSLTKSGSSLILIFGEAAIKSQNEPAQPDKSTATAASVVPPAASVSPAAPVVNKSYSGVVEAIEFTQSEGASRITVRTSGACRAGEPIKTSKGLLVAFKACRLPKNLSRQLDTHGFESAIKSITPSAQKRGAAPETKILVALKHAVPNSISRDKDLFQWDFKDPSAKVKTLKTAKASKAATVSPNAIEGEISGIKQAPADDAFALDKASQPVNKQGKRYTGRKVTLEFSDADIRKIFQLLAEVSNQNILVSDDVTGTISLKLVNVPWDQALDVILENKGLGMQKEGNIVQIRPKVKMKSLDDEAIEMRLTEEKKMPLSTVIFDINYATLTDIETQFKAMKSKRTDSSITIDTRTRKIIVIDIDPNIRKMRSLLESLDVPEKQVMIEARIVEASSTFARDIGVKWSFGYQDGTASIANINSLTGSMGGVVTNVLPTGTTGGLVTGMSFGKLLSNIQLDMRLSAAATVGQVKIISTPRVLTVNNKAAKISQGQSIPYQNTSSTDGAKTEFIEAALSLEVTPNITADGSVNMKIKASNNSAGTGSPPPINKKEATTELVVKNGETTVIGGIFVDSDTETDTGIPYLSSIPLLGWLFKSNSQNKTRNELLIFITPRIVN